MTRNPEVNGEHPIVGNDVEGVVVLIDELKALFDVFESNPALLVMLTHCAEITVGTMEVELLILERNLDVDERRFSV